MRKFRFEDNEIYHVYNRGVEKRDVYQNDGDYLRFVHHLYELNDTEQARNLAYHFSKRKSENKIVTLGKRNQLVRILAFTLMPNHFHLLLQEITEGGISKFMQKLGTGYTMFFNEKYVRTGGLFQGTFKAVHIETDAQLRYILHYIHLNPTALYTEKSEVHQKQLFLKQYKWSSFPDYTGGRSFPSVTDRSDMLGIFGSIQKYEESVFQFLKNNTLPDDVSTSIFIDFHQTSQAI